VKLSIISALTVMLAAGGCTTHYHMMTSGRIEMYLMAPQAQSVVLVVSGDPFQQVQAQRDSFGMWKVTLSRMDQFTYFYLVDGKAVLPDCRMREHDDFGSNNCVYTP
jgi:hypothetical protein